jgi:hypothetical protein
MLALANYAVKICESFSPRRNRVRLNLMDKNARVWSPGFSRQGDGLCKELENVMHAEWQ